MVCHTLEYETNEIQGKYVEVVNTYYVERTRYNRDLRLKDSKTERTEKITICNKVLV